MIYPSIEMWYFTIWEPLTSLFYNGKPYITRMINLPLFFIVQNILYQNVILSISGLYIDKNNSPSTSRLTVINWGGWEFAWHLYNPESEVLSRIILIDQSWKNGVINFDCGNDCRNISLVQRYHINNLLTTYIINRRLINNEATIVDISRFSNCEYLVRCIGQMQLASPGNLQKCQAIISIY